MVPKVFISYSVESEEHSRRVKAFADRLRRKGMNVLLFDDIKYGERFSAFMEKIEICDFVLFICTPEYKKRADERKGGVATEWNIITASVVDKYDELKYIPVLFSGDWELSLPIWAKGKKGVDYREESSSEFKSLVKNIKEYAEMESLEILGEEPRRKIMTITNEDGYVEEVEVVIAFEFKDTKKEYVVYTKGECDRKNNLAVYVSNIDRTSGNPKLLGIESDEVWERIKEVLKELGTPETVIEKMSFDEKFLKNDDDE